MLWCDESLPKSAEILRFSWNQETKNQDYTEVLGKILVLMRRFFWNQEPRLSPRLLCNLGSWFLGSRKISRCLKIVQTVFWFSCFL